jgi:hypothetical protein
MTATTWWTACWVICRILRWAFWFAAIANYAYFLIDREGHLDQYGNLTSATEAFMFGLPFAAVFMGYFELMMRERAGLPRPTFGRVTHRQNWPSPKDKDPGAKEWMGR